jgi:hypothetical protein
MNAEATARDSDIMKQGQSHSTKFAQRTSNGYWASPTEIKKRQ